MFDSDNVIANAYGFPYLFDSDANVPEDADTTIKRIAVLNQRVVNWIAENRRIPSSNPNAPEDERNIAHWMRVLDFYANVVVDNTNEHYKEMTSNDKVHAMCQYLIRKGHLPTELEDDDSEYEID